MTRDFPAAEYDKWKTTEAEPLDERTDEDLFDEERDSPDDELEFEDQDEEEEADDREF